MVGHCRFAVVALTAGALLVAASASAAAQELLKDELTRQGDAPWYDGEKNEVVPVRIKPGEPKATHRLSDWEVKPRTTSRTFKWSGLPGLGKWLWRIVWGLMFLAIAVLIVLIVRRLMTRPNVLEPSGPVEQWDPAKVEDLPFELASLPEDLLEEARRALDRGDLRVAIILLFSQQLIHLDRLQWIRLAKGKTNRQYLRELSDEPELRQRLRRSVWLFERVYFGGKPALKSEVESMWNETRELKERFQQPAEIVMAQ